MLNQFPSHKQTVTGASPHPQVTPLKALTSLRFLAALHVVLFHYFFGLSDQPSIIPLGFTGVSFFFILSGFILSYNYDQVEFRSPNSLSCFYIARISRIYPVYIVSLVVALPFFIQHSYLISGRLYKPLYLSSAIFAPLGLHAWIPGAACALNCPSWSVSDELFFYVLFPFVILLVHRRGLILVGALTFTLWLIYYLIDTRLWLLAGGRESLWSTSSTSLALVNQFIKFFPIGRLPEFVAGVLAFQLWNTRENLRKSTKPLFAFAMIASVAIILYYGNTATILLHNGLTIIVWIPVILGAANLRNGLLCSTAAVFLGRISYSLYLLHLPIFFAVKYIDKFALFGFLENRPYQTAIVSIIISIFGAAGAFKFIEEPGRRYFSKKLSLFVIEKDDLNEVKPAESAV